MRTKRYKRTIALVTAIVALLWFVGAQRLRFVDVCGDCHYYARYDEYRLFGAVLWRHTLCQEQALTALIAEDLGAPCEHRDFSTDLIRRYWGFFICMRYDCYDRMTGEPRYIHTEHFRAVVESLARERPELPTEFRQRVIYDDDMEYYGRFLKELEPRLGPAELRGGRPNAGDEGGAEQ